MRHGVLPFAIALAVAVAPGCKASPPTALVLALRTDTMPPEVSSLVVTVTRDGATRFTQTYALPSGAALPGTLTLSNGRDEDPGDSITVVVLGKGTKTVTRTARLGFVREKTKLLRLAVERACIDVPCVDGETCAGGTCVPIDVDPSITLRARSGAWRLDERAQRTTPRTRLRMSPADGIAPAGGSASTVIQAVERRRDAVRARPDTTSGRP